jgi:hypothetical protein
VGWVTYHRELPSNLIQTFPLQPPPDSTTCSSSSPSCSFPPCSPLHGAFLSRRLPQICLPYLPTVSKWDSTAPDPCSSLSSPLGMLRKSLNLRGRVSPTLQFLFSWENVWWVAFSTWPYFCFWKKTEPSQVFSKVDGYKPKKARGCIYPLKNIEVQFTSIINHFQVNNSVAINILTRLYKHRICLISKYSHPPKVKTPYSLSSQSPLSLHPPVPGNYQSASYSRVLPILDISYKWNHPVWDLFCLVSFT